MSAPFRIDPDIRAASTLPAGQYFEPADYALQLERVFARSWFLAPEAEGMITPDRVHPWTLLEGALDEPLVLTCDGDQQVRCLSNVCPHRGNTVVACEGAARTMRCRYHGRRFDLNGRMIAAPGFEGALNFPSSADDLREVPLQSWRGFFFAGLKPIMPLEALLEPMEARVGWLPIEAFVFDPASSRDYVVEASWALYCDNYLEGFHIPFVHPGLAGTLELKHYRTEIGAWSTLQVAQARPDEPAFELPADHPDHGSRIAAWYFWLFPTTMFNFYPWGLSINLVEPLGPTRCRVRFRSYVWREALRERGAGAALDQVELEDEAVVMQVQRGVRSRLYTRGRYAPGHEAGVHHFHRLLTRMLEQD